MGIPSRFTRFSSITGVLFVGLGCAGAVVACSSDDDNIVASTNTGTSTGGDSGTATGDASANASADAGIDADTTNVPVQSYTVGVTVSGLVGTGLVLKNNAGDDLAVAADGSFTFATSIVDGTDFAVSVGTQPTSPSQSCVVSGGNGKLAGANVTGVAVTCTTNTYTVGVTVTNLQGTGLVLTNNDAVDVPGEALTIDANGTFAFTTKIASGAKYDVEVKTRSTTSQKCVVTGNTGTIGADNVTLAVTCYDFVCSDVSENGTLTVACPDGKTIDSFDFLSYGTPSGACGAFVASDCNAGATVEVVQTCGDQPSCTIGANNSVFVDPCSGTGKRLYVQAACK